MLISQENACLKNMFILMNVLYLCNCKSFYIELHISICFNVVGGLGGLGKICTIYRILIHVTLFIMFYTSV